MKLTMLETKVGLILLVFSLSCAPGYIPQVDKSQKADFSQQSVDESPWQIVTYNYQTFRHTDYQLDSYPWGAGTLPGGGVWFNFPSYQDDMEALQGENVIRLWKIYDKPQSYTNYSGLSYSVAVQVQGTPEFFWRTQAINSCNVPATVRPLFFAWYSGLFRPTYEWWAHDGLYTLAEGSAAPRVQFDPALWSDENGQYANFDSDTLSGFNLSLSKLHGIGLSFGGGCFYGHGVSVVGGSARFEMASFAPFSENQTVGQGCQIYGSCGGFPFNPR